MSQAATKHNRRLTGIIAAAATPVRADWSIDRELLQAHCAQLLQRGCDGINLLGTTGEATSFSLEERLGAMEAIAHSKLPLDRFMVGTGAASLADAVRLTSAARAMGFAGALLLPPFYYKGIDDDSLAAYVSAVIERVGPAGLHLYLYNFPQNSGVPYPIAVVERLRKRYPEQLLGLKDSSGDIDYATELAQRLTGFDVFPSAEGALIEAQERGFAGCISATTNVTGPLAAEGWRAPGTAAGRRAIERAAAVRAALSTYPVIACVKWALADLYGDEIWQRLCPPLRALNSGEQQGLKAKLAATAYGELRAPAWA
jgi:4-hydroxy-tetrahydrodipicolinate synthase